MIHSSKNVYFRRLHGCILVFINFIVTSAAQIATLVNWKWVSTCLWPCFVYQRYKGEFSYLMICLMQSMPFHRSAAALALQHKHVNVNLSPRCPTESKFSTFCILFVCEIHNTCFYIELVLLVCVFIKCRTVSAFLSLLKGCELKVYTLSLFLCSIKCPFFSCFCLSL